MDPGGMLLEDFGQRVDLTRRIREGTTALRELIQNADDAGASRVRLCLDRHTHGASSLLAPALAQRTTTPPSPTRTSNPLQAADHHQSKPLLLFFVSYICYHYRLKIIRQQSSESFSYCCSLKFLSCLL